MVDFHYIKRGNKVYGPYYYRSYRVGKNIKKEYFGKNNGKRFSMAIPWRNILDTVRKIRPSGNKTS